MATTIGTLKYCLAQVKNSQKPSEAQKWYARAVQDRTVAFEDFVTHMTEYNFPYSRGVIHGVLIDKLACLQELVLDGKSVSWANWVCSPWAFRDGVRRNARTGTPHSWTAFT